MTTQMQMNRRGFLQATGALSATLVVGFNTSGLLLFTNHGDDGLAAATFITLRGVVFCFPIKSPNAFKDSGGA